MRRRLALWLDPSLREPTPPVLFPYGWHEVGANLRTIAETLAKIERTKRRPRIVLCRHPELHPEDFPNGVPE